MKRTLMLLMLLVAGFLFATCSETTTGPITNDTPTEAYKRLFAAAKSKNTEAIKAEMTKKTIDFGVMVSQRNNKPIEEVYSNAFTATTMSESLPTIRDERIDGEMGAIEVWNTSESRWEDLPFIVEDGRWKIAIGELWGGTYKSPGKGRDMKEREAANAMGFGPTPISVDPANTISVESMDPKAREKRK